MTSAYDRNEPARQAKTRSVLHWLSHHKPVVVELVDDQNETHRLTIDQKNSKRWTAAWRDIQALNGCTLRALDARDGVLSTYAVRDVPTADEQSPVTPATTGGYDIASIVEQVTKANVQVMTVTVEAMTKAHAASFNELYRLAKEAHDDTRELVKAARDDMRQRRIELDEAHDDLNAERVDREREQAEAQDREDKMFAVMKPLIEAAAPELVQKVFSAMGSMKASPKVIEAKPNGTSPEVAPSSPRSSPKPAPDGPKGA